MKKLLHSFVQELSQWWFNRLTVPVYEYNLSFRYIVKYPGREKAWLDLPMLIALHGDGDSVDNFYRTVLHMFSASVRIILIEGSIVHECGMVWPLSSFR